MKIIPLALIASLLLMTACSSSPKQSLIDGSAQAAKTTSNEQWHCEGDKNKQWRCRDLASVDDEGIEVSGARTQTEATYPETPNTAPSSYETQTSLELAENTPVTAPLSTQAVSTPADHSYVVQLIAAREAITISRFKQQNPQVTTRELSVEKDGERWLVLILGTYSNYAEAQTAVAEIMPPLANQPWIRPIAPIRDLLKNQL